MSLEREAFYKYCRRNMIPSSEYHRYWPTWKAAVQWQRKEQK